MAAWRARLALASIVLALGGATASAAPVVVQYSAQVTTVVGTPFGLDNSALNQPVSGFWQYDTATPDTDPLTLPTRGYYDHAAGGAFQAALPGGQTVAGSIGPRVEIEDLNPDTFRFIDGATPGQGTMSVNSVANASVELSIAITDSSGAAFNSDDLPDPFPLGHPGGGAYPYSHTFSLKDSGGTLLMQFVTVTPEPSIFLFGAAPAMLLMRRRTRA